MVESAETPIWRYMDLARYALLLTRGLFFARADRFKDPWEGSWGGANLLKFRLDNQQLDQAQLKQAWSAADEGRKAALQGVGVSCWHHSHDESAALWELYLPRGLGVAVQSSIPRVQRALAGAGRPIDPISVVYTPYRDLSLSSDPYTLLGHKRPEFTHEREVRFLLRFRDDESRAMQALAASVEELNSRVIAPGPPRPIVRGLWGYASTDPSLEHRVAPDGVHCATDVAELIDRVVLPAGVSYPTRRAVLDISEANGVPHRIVAESSVDAIPFSSIKVVER